MVSDLETDLPDEEEEDDEEEDEGYGARHPRGLEHTPGSSMDNLDSSITGKPGCLRDAYVQNRSSLVMFLLVTRLPSVHFVLTVCSLIKFLKQFWQTLGYYNYRFQKEIRKSMNFKQDIEREIKVGGGVGIASRCDLTCVRRQSRCHPYLCEEI